MEDMATLWNEGVQMWDELKREYFQLHAMIFITINDYPALFCLSGQFKGEKGCVVCLDDTVFLYLKNCKKLVFMGTRRFLEENHEYRRMRSQFDNQIELRRAPKARNGKMVFEMVKNIKTIFRNPSNGKKRKKSSA